MQASREDCSHDFIIKLEFLIHSKNNVIHAISSQAVAT